MNTISEKMHQVKDFVRNPYAWPGGYPKFLICDDGGILCHDCTKSEFYNICDSTLKGVRDGWNAASVGINWENPDLYCDHCGEKIKSAYGKE